MMPIDSVQVTGRDNRALPGTTLADGAAIPRLEAIGLAMAIVLGLALRLWNLGAQSVWIDEAYSLRLAALSPLQIIGETARDNHPPLYYLLLSAWERIGPPTETWARLLSAIVGAALVPVFYAFCRGMIPAPGPLLASLLIAISPMAVWHSQDARMYALVLLCTYLALLLFLRYLRGGSSLELFGFGTALLAALYTHPYGVFLFPILLVHLVCVRKEVGSLRFIRTTSVLLLVGAAYLPWLWIILTRATHVAGFSKPVTLLTIPYMFYAFSVGYSLGPSIEELHRSVVPNVSFLWRHLAAVVATASVFGTPLLAGLKSVRRLGRFRPLVLLLLGLPILMALAVTLMSRIDFNARYVAVSLPAYLVLVALGLTSLRQRTSRAFMVLGIFVLSAASLHNHYTDSRYANEDARSAFRLVESRLRTGDCALVNGVRPAFQFYAGQTVMSRSLDFRYPERIPDAERALHMMSMQCSRLWFISGRDWEDDPLGLARPTVEKFFAPVGQESFPGVRVLELRTRSSAAGGLLPQGARNGG